MNAVRNDAMPQSCTVVQATMAAVIAYNNGQADSPMQISVASDVMATLLRAFSRCPVQDPLLLDLARAILLPYYDTDPAPAALLETVLASGRVEYAHYSEIFALVVRHFRRVRACSFLEG